MKIAIIGAGFTGLSAAYNLLEQGHDVVVFEKEKEPGGLAIGYKEKNWNWTLEKHYHHWFTNDSSVLNLAKKINHKVIIKRPKTSVLIDNKIFQFDSPKEVLLFPKLPVLDRLRMGAVLGFIKFNPFWKPMEKINAVTFLPKTIGEKGYKMIWEPLFKNKFGEYAKDISLAWFWARLSKRTPSLAYPEGGFLEFANHLTSEIRKKGGKVYFDSTVEKISEEKKVIIKIKNNLQEFDKVIFTLPSFLFLQITENLPANYKDKFSKLKGLGATNMVLRLKKPFLPDGTYWLNVCDLNSPIMAVVEHTNFMESKNYGNEHLLYLGNYLSPNSERFNMTKEETLKLFDKYLIKINPEYKKYLIGFEFFKVPFGQPIIPRNYSKIIPPFNTPFKNIYLANIEQVYPWDRGTNYAVELGEKITKFIIDGN